MEYSGKKTQCLNSDMISNLPQNIIESILSLMPLRDALRTSILSKKWRYSWRSMPKLTFTDSLVDKPSISGCTQFKCKVAAAVFHVLLFHNGPEILDFECWIDYYDIQSMITQIFSYLARGNTVKQVIFTKNMRVYKLPLSFFSLQGLERIHLENCIFEPPLTFNRFSRLTHVTFVNVDFSVQMLQLFFSKCPLLEHICLGGGRFQVSIKHFAAEGNKSTFVDLLQFVPLIQSLDISNQYIKNLFAVGMSHKLPTSLVRLKYLYLSVCFMKQNEISFALFMIRRSPMLERIKFRVYDNENLKVETDILDLEDYPDLKLDRLETLEITIFKILPAVTMDFVKLIMAKSRVLKMVRILLFPDVSVDEEVKMLRDLVLLPFPRASPSAKLIVARG